MRLPEAGLAAVLALGGVWTLGFTVFDHAARAPALPPPPADAIVVLTGGADRIETAMHLLMHGAAPELLVSGAGRGNDLPEVAKRAQVDADSVRAQITIGHVATDTIGNASETAAWASTRSIRRLIVVTAGYHMARALRELHARLPEVQLYPVPVQPPGLRSGSDFATLRLLASEFDKLLAADLGLSHLKRSAG